MHWHNKHSKIQVKTKVQGTWMMRRLTKGFSCQSWSQLPCCTVCASLFEPVVDLSTGVHCHLPQDRYTISGQSEELQSHRVHIWVESRTQTFSDAKKWALHLCITLFTNKGISHNSGKGYFIELPKWDALNKVRLRIYNQGKCSNSESSSVWAGPVIPKSKAPRLAAVSSQRSVSVRLNKSITSKEELHNTISSLYEHKWEEEKKCFIYGTGVGSAQQAGK